MSYFLAPRFRIWKYFNSPYNSFWCCTGTGVEEYAKTADTIYFHDDHSIFVNLFIASEVDWPEKGLRLEQQTNFPEEEGTALVFHPQRPIDMTLNIRIPGWATSGGTIRLNGTALPAFSGPGSYLTLPELGRKATAWRFDLPMSLRIETLPGDDTQQAVMYGPLVLAGRLGREGLTKPMFYAEYSTTPHGDAIPVPAIATSSKDPLGWLKPVAGQQLTFQTVGRKSKSV